MISSLFSAIVSGVLMFALHALALKIAAGAMGAPSTQNTYSRAMSVAFWLLIAEFFIGFVPLVSLPIYAIVWLIVIMSVYELSLMRSIGVALVQLGVKGVLVLLLKLVGLPFAAFGLLA